MGNNTPSSRRRDGRNAFHPMGNPEELCQYDRTSYYYQFYFPDFLKGWEEAEKEWQEHAKELEKDPVPCCDYCLKLKEEVAMLKEWLWKKHYEQCPHRDKSQRQGMGDGCNLSISHDCSRRECHTFPQREEDI